MIDELFDYESWDAFDEMLYAFYDVTMKCSFGPLKKGETYGLINMNFVNGEVEAYGFESVECLHKFVIYLAVKTNGGDDE